MVPINGIEPDVIKRPRVTKPVKLGERVELLCEIKSDPEVKVAWMVGKEHNQKEFTASNNEYTGSFKVKPPFLRIINFNLKI